MKQAPVNSVELWAGDIPGLIGHIAVHYWLVIHRDDHIERWEVWQQSGISQPSWGHLHLNLMPHDQWLDNTSHWREHCWQGHAARQIAEQLIHSPACYAHCHQYRYWPGPNSNTFVQTILDDAEVNFSLAPRGIGKDYLGWYGQRRSDRHLLVSTPLLGLRLQWPDSLELQILTLTFCLRRHPWQFAGPFSRPAPPDRR